MKKMEIVKKITVARGDDEDALAATIQLFRDDSIN
jgi:hypothetical protein